VEIALTADVAVAQGLVVGRLVEESAIEAALEDRTDRGDGASLDQDTASAGRIDARIVVASGQRQDTEAGAKALLGVRPAVWRWTEADGGRGTFFMRSLALGKSRKRVVDNRWITASCRWTKRG